MKRGIESPVRRGLSWTLGALLLAGCGGGGGGGNAARAAGPTAARDHLAGDRERRREQRRDGLHRDRDRPGRQCARPSRSSGGADRADFAITAGGALSFAVPPDFEAPDRRRPEQCLSRPDLGQRRHDQRRARPGRHGHQCRPGRLRGRAGSAPASSQPLYLDRQCRTARAGCSSSSTADRSESSIRRPARSRRRRSSTSPARSRPTASAACSASRRRPISPRPGPSTSS